MASPVSDVRETKGEKESQSRKKRFPPIHFALNQYSVLQALALLSKRSLAVFVNLGSGAQDSEILRAQGPAMLDPYEENR
jgi:hypothetical protein